MPYKSVNIPIINFTKFSISLEVTKILNQVSHIPGSKMSISCIPKTPIQASLIKSDKRIQYFFENYNPTPLDIVNGLSRVYSNKKEESISISIQRLYVFTGQYGWVGSCLWLLGILPGRRL